MNKWTWSTLRWDKWNCLSSSRILCLTSYSKFRPTLSFIWTSTNSFRSWTTHSRNRFCTTFTKTWWKRLSFSKTFQVLSSASSFRSLSQFYICLRTWSLVKGTLARASSSWTKVKLQSPSGASRLKVKVDSTRTLWLTSWKVTRQCLGRSPCSRN